MSNPEKIKLVQKADAKNIFSLPTTITVSFFLLSTIYVDVDQAMQKDKFTTRDAFKIVYLLLGGMATLVARSSEGKTGVYTNKGFIGLNKEDYLDTVKTDDRYI